MKHTLNVKIVLFTIIILMVLISSSVIFVLDLAKFEGSEGLFLPLIIGMIFTIIRIFNNLNEKSKIIAGLKADREINMDQEKMQFTTCPEYWTKTTENDQVICRNEFTNKADETSYIGGLLSNVSSPSDNLKTEDIASNIGFAFDVTETDGNHDFENINETYIPSMRSNLTLPVVKNRVIESFEDGDGDHDTVPHKHHRTYVDYAHTDKPVAWVDGVDRVHDSKSYNDSKHLVIYNEEVYHDHSTNNVYDYAGNLIWGISSKKTTASSESNADIPAFSNNDNWISPHQKTENLLLAEINLNELNKASNKCHLAKNLPWIEAKNKCANVNVKFDM
tara:strand:+ start:1 stop:1002 length:1002 start_codon:yes stop_codon:yes gene_type:complete